MIDNTHCVHMSKTFQPDTCVYNLSIARTLPLHTYPHSTVRLRSTTAASSSPAGAAPLRRLPRCRRDAGVGDLLLRSGDGGLTVVDLSLTVEWG